MSVKNIWDKASNDEAGLQKYYDTHKAKYRWEKPHAKGILVQALNDSIGNVVKENIKDLPSDSIVKFVKSNFKKTATADRFNMPEGSNPIIDNLVFGAETEFPKSKIYKTFFVIEGRIVETPEDLNDVRGAVVADYQEVLEEEWVGNLKQNHKVELNNKELARVRKNLK